jgi:hypothetical protein
LDVTGAAELGGSAILRVQLPHVAPAAMDRDELTGDGA